MCCNTLLAPLSCRAAAKLLARLHKLEIILASKKAESTASIDGVTDPKLQRTLQTGIVTAGARTYVLAAHMFVRVLLPHSLMH